MANPLNNGLTFKLATIAVCQFTVVTSLPPDVSGTVQNVGSAVLSVVDDRTFRGWLDRFCDRKRDNDDDQQQQESDSQLPDSDEDQDDQAADPDNLDPNSQESPENGPDDREGDPGLED
ncbi:hypothetical protein NEA10_02930 [Phormidium yuhuli AB48]|uniref:Uncharacterized protein n=1 Tax=Phormidium yuhuli AB48 TaxID=2940671 RepID=A0ABY5AU88_9CYAN|nr:hypothetical protein [Phormidium yuhuli]USR91698.1 hypothetical protein NEA10_02930 [Phormidium yuhuli AB48]